MGIHGTAEAIQKLGKHNKGIMNGNISERKMEHWYN